MSVIVLGLSHKTTPIEIREKFALTRDKIILILKALKDIPPLDEVVILSTCNRFEIYANTSIDSRAGFLALEAYFRTHLCPEGISPHAFYRYEGKGAIQQIFRVSAGLDSMVVGETEILGQVREAYQCAQQTGTTGKLLNVLFQRALFVGKLIRTETRIAGGISSIGSAAVHFAEKIFGTLENKRILLIGAGKMAEVAIRHLLSHKPGALVVLNRTRSKAEELARIFNGIGQSMDEITEEIQKADIIIASTSADGPVVTRSMMEPIMKARKEAPIYLVDIGVPRNVEPGVETLPQVHLYNIDDLRDLVGVNLVKRIELLGHAETVVMGMAEEFYKWTLSQADGKHIPLSHKTIPAGKILEPANAASNRRS